MIELNQFEIGAKVTKKNKLNCITEIPLNLDELNNRVNLKDGRPRNKLLTCYVTDSKDFTHFELTFHSTRPLKMENLLS